MVLETQQWLQPDAAAAGARVGLGYPGQDECCARCRAALELDGIKGLKVGDEPCASETSARSLDGDHGLWSYRREQSFPLFLSLPVLSMA